MNWWSLKESWRWLLVSALLGSCLYSEATSNAKVHLNGEWTAFEHSDVTPSFAPMVDIESPTTRIYVSISSFRDYRCPNTLRNLFTKAAYPDRIRVGLIHQPRQETSDKDCLKEYCAMMGASSNNAKCKYRDNISNMEMSAIDSKGPSFSRYLHSLMLADEEFYLQIDSHMDFVSEWDVQLLREWSASGNEFAILSSYPADISQLTASKTGSKAHLLKETPYLCKASFTKAHLVRYERPVGLLNLPAPTLQPYWSSMFSFSRSHAMRRVPHDPNLQQAYDGVDFSISARLWTRGYDFYAPSKSMIFHDYKAAMNPAAKAANDKAQGKEHVEWVAWTENGNSPWHKRKMYGDSVLRLKTLLNSPGGERTPAAIASLTRFGLGSARTLEQYFAFSGVNTETLTTEGRCQGGLRRVQPVYNSDVADVWGDALEMRHAGGENVPLLGGAVPRLDMSGLWHHMHYASVKGGATGEGETGRAEDGMGGEEQPDINTVVLTTESADANVNANVGLVGNLAAWLLGIMGSQRALKIALLMAPVALVILFLAVAMVQSEDDYSLPTGYHHSRRSARAQAAPRSTTPVMAESRGGEKLK